MATVFNSLNVSKRYFQPIILLLFFGLFLGVQCLFGQGASGFPYGSWNYLQIEEDGITSYFDEEQEYTERQKAIEIVEQLKTDFLNNRNIVTDFSSYDDEDDVDLTRSDLQFNRINNEFYYAKTIDEDDSQNYGYFLIKKIDANNYYAKIVGYKLTPYNDRFIPMQDMLDGTAGKTSIDIEIINIKASSNTPTSNSNNSTSGYEPESEEGEDGTLWTVIVGVIATATLLAIRNRIKKRKKATSTNDKDKPKDKKEIAEYILQLNKKEFSLKLNEPKTLTAKVWKITEKGKSLTNATIKIHSPEKALKMMPFNVVGTLNSQITLKEKPKENQFYITITASVDGHSYQKQVRINAGIQNRIVIETAPNNTRSLRPNIDQNLTCFAQVVDADNKDIPELTKKIKFDNSNVKWIDLLEDGAYLDEGWAAMIVGASDPSTDYDISHPPQSVTLPIYVDYEEENEEIRLENNLKIDLLDCKLETDLEQLTFPATEKQSEITFKANIEDCDGCLKPWKFKAVYMKDYETIDDKPLTTIDIEIIDDTEVKITLTGPILIPEEGAQFLRKLFVVSAQQEDEKALERHIYVMVSKEGLFIEKGVDDNNEISIVAKGDFEQQLVFSLYVYNPETDEVEPNEDALKYLEFELVNEDTISKNINEVLQTDFHFENIVGTMKHGYYRLFAPFVIPGTGDKVYELNYKVTAPNLEFSNKDTFQQLIKLKVETYGIGKDFPEWREAYDRCYKHINLFVVDRDKKSRLFQILKSKGKELDAYGLVQLDKKIIQHVTKAIEQKGKEWNEHADFLGDVIEVLEYVEWAGDLAFQVVVSTYLGPKAGFAASAFKGVFLTGVRMVIEGKSVDYFIDEQLATFKEMMFSVAKGGLINTRNIEKYYKGSKFKVWGIYAVATFAIAFKRTGSIPEAAKTTARQLRDEAIIRFLNGHVQKEQAKLKAQALKEKNSPKKKAEKKITKEKYKSTRVKKTLDDLESKIKNGLMDKADVLKIMKDPAMVRTIKEHGSHTLKMAFNEPRKRIYKEHDRNLKSQIAKQEGISADDLRIGEFRTPGTKGFNLNTDRDYRLLRRHKMAGGKEVWLEVPRKKWLNKSYKELGRITGKPPNMTVKQWAEKLQQRGTDRFDAEACADYSDHSFNPKTGEMRRVTPNVVKVMKGKGTLLDPDDMGRMYKQKVINAGNTPEAFAQAKKGTHTLKKVREGYEKQGYKLKKLDPKLEQAMRIIENQKVTTASTPSDLAHTKELLNKLKFKGGVNEVMNKVANEFKTLKSVTKGSYTERFTDFLFK